MSPQIPTYLFAWNPDKWEWTNLDEQIEDLKAGRKVIEEWSCTSHKRIRVGDRAFLTLVGSKGRGIVGSGYIASEPFLSKHWGGKEKFIHNVMIEFDALLNPFREPYLTLELLKMGPLEKQHWTPQTSGISIKPDLVEELEAVWKDFISTAK